MHSATMEKSAHGAHAFGHHASFAAPASAGPAAGHMMVPRCTMKVEKCAGGMKLHCHCEDELSCATLQNLCKMLCDGMCSCCCTMNGVCVCQCNLACGHCTCEYTKDGVCITCKSGDKACCDMIQACCDCIHACLHGGCCCYVSYHNTPVCCGSC